MKPFVILSLLVLAACGTAPDVVKTGPGTYRVRPEAGGGSPTDADIKARGIARANEYCAADGKHAVITVGQTTGWLVLGLQTAEVQFYCDDRPPVSADKSAAKP